MEKESIVNQFCEICNTSKDRANFFLEAANWNLDAAIAEFYSESNDNEEMADPDPVVPSESSHVDPVDVSAAPVGSNSSNSRFGTIAGLQRRGGGSSDSSDDSDQGQAFYVGGSEKGAGQQVLGPPRRKPEDIVKDVFKSARDHGAEEVEAGSSGSHSSKSGMRAFTGAGRRLGETLNDDLVVQGPPTTSSARQRVDMVLKMWSNGFSIDDGPLREFSDPKNKDFLESIKNGSIPSELIQEAAGGQVNLDMEDHHTEEYRAPPRPKVKAFAGAGHVLGSPAPSVIQSVHSPSVPVGPAPQLDSSAPITQVQLRLADGSRLVAKLNHTHTVADLRQYLLSERPQYAGANFVLMTTFPNIEITDESLSLTQAGLLNAAVVQKLK